jgi:hypothetical protein
MTFLSNSEAIICCAGPSFNVDRFRDMGRVAHIAAISTVMRHLEGLADYWIMVDPPMDKGYFNRNYAPDGGMRWMNDPGLIKVLPDRKKTLPFRDYPSTKLIPYTSGPAAKDAKDGRTFMDGKLPLLRSTHMSLTFAIQWLIHVGYTKLYFAGVDLRSKPKQLRSWHEGSSNLSEATRLNKAHARCLAALKEWIPIGQAKGIEFISLTPNSPINQLMPYHD